MELYGYQQSLAKLQMTLEQAQEGCTALSDGRLQVGVATAARAPLVAAADAQREAVGMRARAPLPRPRRQSGSWRS